MKEIPDYIIESLEKKVVTAKTIYAGTLRDECIQRYYGMRGMLKNLGYDLKKIKHLDEDIKRLL